MEKIMNQTGIAALKDAITNSACSDSVLIWGACERNIEIQRLIEEWGFTVEGYIDRQYKTIKSFNGRSVFSAECLSEKKHFVFVGLKKTSPSAIATLKDNGYKEFIDYWYPTRSVILDGTQDYSDPYGNTLSTICKTPCSVKLVNGGHCILGNAKIESNITVTDGGTVKIGSGVTISKDTGIKALSGTIQVDDNCSIATSCILRTSCNGILHICRNVTLQFQCALVASLNSKIIIGEDCMISYHVFIRSGNSHNIIDLDTGENLDMNDRRDVVLGTHVWLGMRTTIMSGAKIGSGSTVGANSFVNKVFPNNCTLAGNPARIVRKRSAWIRDGRKIHDDPADYADFIYDKEGD